MYWCFRVVTVLCLKQIKCYNYVSKKPNKANKAITAQDTSKEALKDGEEDVPGNPAKKKLKRRKVRP